MVTTTTTMASQTRTPVKASSRLLTMKFMRPGLPFSSSPHSTNSTPLKTDRAAINSAIAEDEAKREAALIASGAADERWYLNFEKKDDPDSPPGEKIGNVRIIMEGQGAGLYGDEDESDSEYDSDDREKMAMVGKRSFGGWTRKEKVVPKKRKEDSMSDSASSDSDASSSGSNSSSEDEEAKRRRKKKEKARKKQAKQDNNSNRTNGMGKGASSSGPHGPSPGGLRGLADIKCFNCGKTGHFKSDCLQNNRRNDKHDPKRRKVGR